MAAPSDPWAGYKPSEVSEPVPAEAQSASPVQPTGPSPNLHGRPEQEDEAPQAPDAGGKSTANASDPQSGDWGQWSDWHRGWQGQGQSTTYNDGYDNGNRSGFMAEPQQELAWRTWVWLVEYLDVSTTGGWHASYWTSWHGAAPTATTSTSSPATPSPPGSDASARPNTGIPDTQLHAINAIEGRRRSCQRTLREAADSDFQRRRKWLRLVGPQLFTPNSCLGEDDEVGEEPEGAGAVPAPAGGRLGQR